MERFDAAAPEPPVLLDSMTPDESRNADDAIGDRENPLDSEAPPVDDIPTDDVDDVAPDGEGADAAPMPPQEGDRELDEENAAADSAHNGRAADAAFAGELFISAAPRVELDLGAGFVTKRKTYSGDDAPKPKKLSGNAEIKELFHVRGRVAAKGNARETGRSSAEDFRSGGKRRVLVELNGGAQEDKHGASPDSSTDKSNPTPEEKPSADKGNNESTVAPPDAVGIDAATNSPAAHGPGEEIPQSYADKHEALPDALHGEGELSPAAGGGAPIDKVPPAPLVSPAPPPTPNSSTSISRPLASVSPSVSAPVSAAPTGPRPPSFSAKAAPALPLPAATSAPSANAPPIEKTESSATPPASEILQSAAPVAVIRFPVAVVIAETRPSVTPTAAAPPRSVASPPPTRSAGTESQTALPRSPNSSEAAGKPASTPRVASATVTLRIQFNSEANPARSTPRSSHAKTNAVMLASVAPNSGGAREAARARESAPADADGQILSRSTPMRELPPSQATPLPEAAPALVEAGDDASLVHAVAHELPESAAREGVDAQPNASARAASAAEIVRAAPAVIDALFGSDFCTIPALEAVAGLEALDRAVDELVDELNDMGEQFADLFSTGASPPMTAAVASVAVAGLFELRLRRKRPPRCQDADWIWLFSDLLGDAPDNNDE